MGVLELRYTHLCALSPLPEASGAAQVYGNWGVVEVLGGIRRIIALEVVLVIPLLSLFWDKSSQLVVILSPEDLIDSFLGDDTVDGSFLKEIGRAHV